MTDHAETLRQWDNEPEHKEALAALERERDEAVNALHDARVHEVELLTENARLREALERIARHPHGASCDGLCHAESARDALTTPDQEGA